MERLFKSDFTIGKTIEQLSYDKDMCPRVVRQGVVLAHVSPGDDLTQHEKYPLARIQMVGGGRSGLIVRWADRGVELFVSDAAWIDYPGIRPAA